jgi:hypothetical protein
MRSPILAGLYDPDDRAASLLQHYFRTAFQAAGLPWNEDNDAEVRSIVSNLTDVVYGAVREHAEDAPHPYPDEAVL